MKHLLPTSDAQTIKIIPRVYSTSVTIKLRDDSTNDEVTILPSAIINKNYVELSNVYTLSEVPSLLSTLQARADYYENVTCTTATLTTMADNLIEGRFYDLKVYNGQGSITEADIIYRDKIFCTAQSTNQSNNEHYTINKDVYKEKSGNNDFIILWVNV